jgi:hypothetical protein
MLTYQLRPRIFRHKGGDRIAFPADVELRFHFQPLQPFGMQAGGGRTFVKNVAASLFFNANTGEHTIVSEEPLQPLDVIIEEPVRTVRLAGNVLSITQHFDHLDELERLVTSVYFAFPVLLNVKFADPPIVERVDGRIGACEFRWELDDWHAEVRGTTQDQQEDSVTRALERMTLLSEPGRRRLIAALHYFHAACRHARRGSTPGEFLAEVLLNLSKTLEAIFPPSGDGKTRDAVRAGLRQLNFSTNDIERNFLPAMALRNQIDVGHVEFGLFTMEQLRPLHAYIERAESAFRDLLDRVLEGIVSGSFATPSHEPVSNGLRGYHFFGELGTSPKRLRFSQVVSGGLAWRPRGSALRWE